MKSHSSGYRVMRGGTALTLAMIMAIILMMPGVAFPDALQEVKRDSFSPDGIRDVMRKACDYQLDLQARNAATLKSDINHEWVKGSFYTGVMALFEATGDSKYLDSALQYGEGKKWELDIPDTRNADWQCIGQVYLELYLMKKDPGMLAGIKRNMDAQMAAPKPGRVDWWWCDALYMAPPVLVRLYAATGEKKYLDYLNTMYWDTWDFLYDREEHLFFRDKNYFNAKTKNGRKVFWSRGNGWVLGGLARILKYLPEDDPGRPRFETLFKEMSARLAELQPEDGLWRPSLLDPDDFATSETSGTAFFTFGMAWGINNGLLDREKYEPVVKKGWAGLVRAVSPEGRLCHVQTVAAAPGPVKPQDTREYAAGAFLLAGNEILKMLEESGAGTQAAPAVKTLPPREHPFLFAGEETLARARERCRKQPWAAEYLSDLLEKAGRSLGKPVEIPAEGGQWSQHYVCKSCGSRLSHENGKHLCPRCGKEYTGWPYDEVIAGNRHRANWKEVENCGLAYALTHDEKFARRAREILIAYADRYTSYPFHDYKGGTMKRGARVLAQTLDEAVGIIGVAWGYDLIYNSPCMTADDRVHIEEHFFREVAKTLLRNDMSVSNWQSWHNGALSAIGFCLGDADLAHESIDGKSGFRFQLKKSILSDGFWYEGSPGYHFYALEALRWTAEAARGAGIDLVNEPAYQSMYEAPVGYVFPDLTFPVINDTDSFPITREHDLYELAYARYGKPAYGAVALKAKRRGLQSVLWGPDDLSIESFGSAVDFQSSRDYPGVGALMLRQGQGNGQVCVHLHYGPHGGAHGHPAKLGVVVYALGQIIAPDPGRLAYASPLHAGWYKTTLAHNTILADGKSQEPTQARLIAFEEKDGLSCAQAECTTAYPDITLTRTLAVSSRYVLDVVTAESATSHTYDLAWHIQGEPRPDFEASPAESLGKSAGFQHLKDVSMARTDQTWSVDYRLGKSGGTRMTMMDAPQTQVYLASGLLGNPPNPCPVALARRSGNATRYITLIEPYETTSAIKQIEVSDVTIAGQKYIRVTLSSPGGKEIVDLRSPENPSGPLFSYQSKAAGGK